MDSSKNTEQKKDKKATILIIDDSVIILKTMQVMLKNEYRVILSSDGIEGYRIAKSKQPDLILLDYNMPDVDGEKTMMMLKDNSNTANIPVIFVSGVSDKDKILKVANLKPAGYLLKPVQKENLVSVISQVLNSQGTEK